MSVCVSVDSHRNGVVRTKTLKVVISRLGGDAVFMSVKTTRGRGMPRLPFSLEFLHFVDFKLENVQNFTKKTDCRVEGSREGELA